MDTPQVPGLISISPPWNFLTQLHIHLQEKADSLEEKRVLLERKVARAERDRDIATVSEETPKKPQVLTKILVNLHSELRTGAMITDLFPEMIIEIGELWSPCHLPHRKVPETGQLESQASWWYPESFKTIRQLVICKRHETSDLCEESEAEQERADMEAFMLNLVNQISETLCFSCAEFWWRPKSSSFAKKLRRWLHVSWRLRSCARRFRPKTWSFWTVAGRAGDWPLAFRRSAVRIWWDWSRKWLPVKRS